VRGSFWIDREFALEFLLHDAAEALLGDVATPLKVMLPDYKVIEHRVEAAIAKKFGTSFPMLPEVKVVDTRMLKTEVINLMPQAAQEWECLKGVKPYPITLIPWEPRMAKQKFLERYYELTKGK
jgi:5'-deoxynucleotidase YfbR-like HD superfamily hydrolase